MIWTRDEAGAYDAGVRIALCCAIVLVSAPAVAVAEADDWFRVGPYLRSPSPDAVTLVWEGEGARAAEVRIEGDERVWRLEPALRQAVRIEGLSPGARHGYEVRAGDAVARGELQAAPPPRAAIRFAVFGNTRLDERAQRLVGATARAQAPDLALSAGNLVSDGLSDHDWRRWFSAKGPLLRDTAIAAAIGSHDLQGEHRSADALAEYVGAPDRYHALSYGPARFLFLDSNLRDEAFEEQTEWLRAELKAARANPEVEHIFALSHHGPYSVGRRGGDERIRDAWAPLFEEHGVDAVFSAHDHVYSRAEAGGVRYIMTGGGGAPLYPRSRGADEASREAIRRFESAHHLVVVDVASGAVEMTALRLDQSAIETVSWGERRPAGPKVVAKVEELLAPPPPPKAPTEPRRAPADDDGPRDGRIGSLALGLLGVLALLAGSGAIAYSRRRA